MVMRRLLLASVVVVAVAVALTPNVARGAPQDLGKNWRVYNVMPATSKYWDIKQAQAWTDGLLQFPIKQFVSTTSGSFVVYLLNNYNINMTGATLAANAVWTGAVYKTRSGPPYDTYPGAYVRFEFQDVTAGPYDQNDYWWSTVALDLNATQAGFLTASLGNRALWTNMCGKPATDDSQIYQNCIGDVPPTFAAMTPFDGFTNAVKNVKQVGLSFGSSGRYASGVAIDGGIGTFQLVYFTITPP